MKQKNLLVPAVLCSIALFAGGVVRADDAPGTADVTNQVQQAVAAGALTITASNDLTGDPAPTLTKKLKVEYTINGTASSKVVFEGGVVEVHAPKGAKLVVTKATYGDLKDEQKVDVTKALTDAIQGGKLSLGINNETLGGDPAPTIVKKLEVNYTVGGKAAKTTIDEFQTLNLPLPADGKGNLVIVDATYGAL